MKIDTNHPAYVLVFTVVVAAVFTAGIMTLHVATADRVARNESLREEKALIELFALGDANEMTPDKIAHLVAERIRVDDSLVDPETGKSVRILRAYDRPAGDPDARLIGIGFAVSGMGFWAPIQGLMAVTPDAGEVIGIVFLSHSETPGLGARIEEPVFRNQFKGLTVAPPAGAGRYIYIGRGHPAGPEDPKYGRSVDAVTGATQTSVAVEQFLDASLRRFRRAYSPTARKDGP